MDALGGLLMIVGPVALLAALVSTLYYYAKRRRTEHISSSTILRYSLGLLVLAIGGWVIGTIIGISAACSSSNAGNLCGLMGIFGLGPLVSALAIFLFAHGWAKRAQKTL